MPAAAPAIPPNPKSAARIARNKKNRTQPNMFENLLEVRNDIPMIKTNTRLLMRRPGDFLTIFFSQIVMGLSDY
jgi:hypothetical protein